MPAASKQKAGAPSASPAAPAPAAPAKRKATSEIDDIFSGKKPKPTVVPSSVPSAVPPVPAGLSKSARKKLKGRLNALKESEGVAVVAPSPPRVAMAATADDDQGSADDDDDDAALDGEEEEEGNGEGEEEEEDTETFPVLTSETDIANLISSNRSTRPKLTPAVPPPTAHVVETIEFRDPQFTSASSGPVPLPVDDDGSFADSRGSGKVKRRTDDGLAIHTPEELGCGKGKDTPECPFECWCCY
ncbi:hypothetical protein HKX48_006896 [Thoreauomyces humboldtii]|nr:hypothetical protein HKX48_006896 [Thoreauomyces humboldtii]